MCVCVCVRVHMACVYCSRFTFIHLAQDSELKVLAVVLWVVEAEDGAAAFGLELEGGEDEELLDPLVLKTSM